MANHNYRIQQQHIAMARKRQRRRRAASTGMAEFTPGAHSLRSGNGVAVNVRQIGAGDEGILYMHRITVSCVVLLGNFGEGSSGANYVELVH